MNYSSFSRKSKLILGILVMLFFILFVDGSIRHAKRFNTSLTYNTQGGYFLNAMKMRESGFKFVTERNRMPLYIFIQAIFFKGNCEGGIFARAKKVNIAISLIALMAIYAVLFVQLDILYALNLGLLTTFMVFIYYSPYMQCENLYYFLSFVSFLLMLKTFQQPKLVYSLSLGVVLACTYFTKASILPGFILYGIFYLCHALQLRENKKRGLKLNSPFICLVVTICSFILIVYPYINTSKKIFGNYFYNVNATHYFWCDNWGEAQLIRNLNDQWAKPAIPNDKLPSFTKYLRTHHVWDISQRIIRGLQQVYTTCANSYGYFKYVLIYGFLALIGFIMNVRKNILSIKNIYLFWFVVVYFSSYLLLYSWYTYISYINRFILQLFLPVMFILALLNKYFYRDCHIGICGQKIKLLDVFNCILFVFLIYDIYQTLTFRIITMPGGT